MRGYCVVYQVRASDDAGGDRRAGRGGGQLAGSEETQDRNLEPEHDAHGNRRGDGGARGGDLRVLV
eukprot:6307253-Pyramimonas_sp.AAC.2